MAMCAHYLFDPDFCNVASGWEKGVVEKNVQDSRRRIWLDAQKIKWASFAELNVWLGERCRALWSELRHPKFREFSILELLEQERLEMMPTPTAFDGYVERSARVSSTCLVAVARNRYSAPCELAGQRVSTRLYPNRVDIATAQAVVASHARLADNGHVRYDWQHYIALVQRKPGALRNGAPFADLPGPLQRLRQGLMRHNGWRQGDGAGAGCRAHSGFGCSPGGRGVGGRVWRAQCPACSQCRDPAHRYCGAGFCGDDAQTETGAAGKHQPL
jgi:hypothetical protein